MRVFQAQNAIQRGYGIGGLFRGLIRSATPMLKKGLLNIGKRALTMGADALGDVSRNNVSLKTAFKNQAAPLLNLAAQKPISRGSKRKSISLTGHSSRKVRKKTGRRASTRKRKIAKLEESEL